MVEASVLNEESPTALGQSTGADAEPMCVVAIVEADAEAALDAARAAADEDAAERAQECIFVESARGEWSVVTCPLSLRQVRHRC